MLWQSRRRQQRLAASVSGSRRVLSIARDVMRIEAFMSMSINTLHCSRLTVLPASHAATQRSGSNARTRRRARSHRSVALNPTVVLQALRRLKENLRGWAYQVTATARGVRPFRFAGLHRVIE